MNFKKAFKSFFLLALLIAIVTPGVPVSAAGSYSWTTASGLAGATCARMAASSTGQYMVCANYGGDIYTSSDYGANWTAQPSSTTQNWIDVVVSGTGQFMLGSYQDTTIGISNDYGSTWTALPIAGAQFLSYLAISESGKYATVTDDDIVYYSQDYGQSWLNIIPQPGNTVSSVTMSSSGQYRIIGYGSGKIYASNDFGVTWTDQIAVGNHSWSASSMSNNGQYVAIAAGDGTILRSSDYGATWSNISIAGKENFTSLVISNNGQTIVASQYYFQFPVGNVGDIFISYDAGSTWDTDPGLPSNTGWSSITGSGDRSRLAVRNMGSGEVYVGVNASLYEPPVVLQNPSDTTPAVGAPNTGVKSAVNQVLPSFIIGVVGLVILLIAFGYRLLRYTKSF